MAETLTPEHEASVTQLSERHSSLTDAVQDYVDDSVTSSTDELTQAKSELGTALTRRESSLMGLIARTSQKPQPSLVLDFKNDFYLQGHRRIERGYVASELLDFSRPSPKWLWGADGKLKEIGVDELPVQHDPVTGERLGVLLEKASTNIAANSVVDSGWSKAGVTATTSTHPAPDGSTGSVIEITRVDGAGGYTYHTTSNLPIGSLKVASVFVKKVTSANPKIGSGNQSIIFDLDAQTAGEGGSIYPVGDGWFWCVASFELNQADETNRIYPDGATDGSILVWGAMLETETTFAGALIWNDGVTNTTRAADSLTRMLGSELNPLAGTLLVDYVANGGYRDGHIESSVRLDAGSPGNAIRVFDDVDTSVETGPTGWDIRHDSVRSGHMFYMPPLARSTRHIVALAYSATEARLAQNGTVTPGVVDGDIPTVDQIVLGTGLIRKVVYYPYPLTEQELIEVTTHGA